MNDSDDEMESFLRQNLREKLEIGKDKDFAEDAGVLGIYIVLIVFFSILILGYACNGGTYTITPSGCNTSLYTAYTEYYFDQWWLVLDDNSGFCPVSGRSWQAVGKWSGYVYMNCIKYNSDIWSSIDKDNAMSGYESNFSIGADYWWNAGNGWNSLILFFEIVLIAATSAQLIKNKEYFRDEFDHRACLCLILSAVCYCFPFYVFYIWYLVVYDKITHTDLTNTTSWEVSFFKSCDVEIKQLYGHDQLAAFVLLQGIICVCSTKCIILVVFILTRRYCYHSRTRNNDEEQYLYHKDNNSYASASNDGIITKATDLLLSNQPSEIGSMEAIYEKTTQTIE